MQQFSSCGRRTQFSNPTMSGDRLMHSEIDIYLLIIAFSKFSKSNALMVSMHNQHQQNSEINRRNKHQNWKKELPYEIDYSMENNNRSVTWIAHAKKRETTNQKEKQTQSKWIMTLRWVRFHFINYFVQWTSKVICEHKSSWTWAAERKRAREG